MKFIDSRYRYCWCFWKFFHIAQVNSHVNNLQRLEYLSREKTQTWRSPIYLSGSISSGKKLPAFPIHQQSFFNWTLKSLSTTISAKRALRISGQPSTLGSSQCTQAMLSESDPIVARLHSGSARTMHAFMVCGIKGQPSSHIHRSPLWSLGKYAKRSHCCNAKSDSYKKWAGSILLRMLGISQC